MDITAPDNKPIIDCALNMHAFLDESIIIEDDICINLITDYITDDVADNGFSRAALSMLTYISDFQLPFSQQLPITDKMIQMRIQNFIIEYVRVLPDYVKYYSTNEETYRILIHKTTIIKLLAILYEYDHYDTLIAPCESVAFNITTTNTKQTIVGKNIKMEILADEYLDTPKDYESQDIFPFLGNYHYNYFELVSYLDPHCETCDRLYHKYCDPQLGITPGFFKLLCHITYIHNTSIDNNNVPIKINCITDKAKIKIPICRELMINIDKYASQIITCSSILNSKIKDIMDLYIFSTTQSDTELAYPQNLNSKFVLTGADYIK